MVTANGRTYTVKVKRGDLVDLMMACTSASISSGAEKWKTLHDLLKEQLNEQDAKNGLK